MKKSADPEGVRRARGQRGFILLGTIWLLVLGGTIASILMLRSMNQAAEATDAGEALRSKLTLESAIETVAADLLINGNHSPWAYTPSAGTLAVDGRQVDVRLTDENGRLDLNEIDPRALDDALRGLGIIASQRAPIIAAVKRNRAMQRRLISMDEVRALLASSGTPGSACIENELTLYSGYAAPAPDQMSQRLAKATGHAGRAFAPSRAARGSAMRVEVASENGRVMSAVLRVAGVGARPIVISDWSSPDISCPR